MEVNLTPELEAKLNRMAAKSGRSFEQMIQELVQNCIDHDQWFRQEVGKGQA